MSPYKPLLCPVCKNSSKFPHYKTCSKGLSNEEFKLKVLIFNHPKIDLSNKDLIYNLYIHQELSTIDFKLKYDLNIKTLYFILDIYKIPKRNISQANNTKAIKEKFKNTCLLKYGTTNVLSKGACGYNTRKKTLDNRYGVNNIFQLKSIQDKITETHIKRYGQKRVNPYKNFTDEQLYAIQQKKLATMLINNTFPQYYKINKLETRIANCLTSLGISFQYSFLIKKYQFDFKINNIVLEIHGDFWHANPKFYNAESRLNFPGKKSQIIAKDIWTKDIKKQEIAFNAGYKYLSIWENDINSKNDIELEKFILTQLNFNLA